MDKERLTSLKQTLQRNKEFTTLDVIEQLEQGLKLYKKALELFVNWADECDFGYDNLGDLYSEYKVEVESLKYQEGLIHIAVSEAKKELDK